MRIIAGECRGRRLKTPKGMDTRPTQDRVRETIFNVLQNYNVHGRMVLDCYAGTGALGLEALSRGAESLVSVDRRTHRLIMENAKICGFDAKVKTLALSVEKVGERLRGQQFDLVFSDPPYCKDGMDVTIDVLTRYDLLRSKAIIVLECEKEEVFSIPEQWSLLKEQIFGYTKVSYYQFLDMDSREEN